tara:strand:+ start:14449 stop:15696 length:1248 start_codon:yes stop_codon:yes gene_type:complete
MQFLKFGGGRNFYTKDFRNAYHFRPDVAPPRQKFEGYINFVPNRALLGTFLRDTDTMALRTRLSSLVRTAQLPEVAFQTQIVNAFNQKRIVQTGREYSPITVNLFDTIQNEWLTLLMKYFTYNYADATSKFDSSSTVTEENSLSGRDLDTKFLTETFKKYNSAVSTDTGSFGTDASERGFDSNAFGFTQRETPYFFERIDMIMYHGNTGVQYTLVNPIITSINFGDIDYSDSGFKDISIQLQYEYFSVYDQLNFKLGEQDLSRFENVSGVDLPGRYAGDKLPIAITDPTTIKEVMNRKRQPQIFTQYSTGTNEKSNLQAGEDPTYVPRPDPGISDEGGILSKASDWFSDNPFGRILDKGLSAAVNGGDIKDALTGGLFNEFTQGLQNPVEGDIFNGKGKRIDTGSDSNLGDSPDG